jgi:beta-glucosidase
MTASGSDAPAGDFPPGFVWGTATAAHQIEGGNVNNDWWVWEHTEDSGCAEPSGDACDSFWRFPEDVRLVRELGFGAYRFSLEWSRIEPEPGEFSRGALDHYRRVCATCHEHGVLPVVTFHHFTTPRWMAERGGWGVPDVVDHFARFCDRVGAHLGDLIGMACTINEPNIVSLLGYVVGAFPPGHRDFAEYGRVNEHFKSAHRKAVAILKEAPGDFPVGQCIAMGDWWAPDGSDDVVERTRHMHEGQFLEASRGDDFVGVQAYSRTRLDAEGMPLGPEDGVPVVESMGYEYWPAAVEAAVRHAAAVAAVPVYVTENGIGTEDDAQRIDYVTEALRGLERCLADGLDVRGYFYWSLLDNFEWALGYKPRFGLVDVDRDTFARVPKRSARWLGAVARANRLPSS